MSKQDYEERRRRELEIMRLAAQGRSSEAQKDEPGEPEEVRAWSSREY